jgi:hypothetical protein
MSRPEVASFTFVAQSALPPFWHRNLHSSTVKVTHSRRARSPVMSVRLRYRNSRGGRRAYRYAGGRPGGPLRWVVIMLMVLAGLIVIASVIH